jgi:AmmeMemoRadiSam system protein B
MPSPVPDRPGLLIRDPYRYSEQILIIPPPLVSGLALFDGVHTDSDLRLQLSITSGDVVPEELVSHLIEALTNAGFLETPDFEARRRERHSEFANSSVRLAAFEDSGYPRIEKELRQHFDRFYAQAEPRPPGTASTREGSLIGLAAPHVSPDGGWQAYAAAYANLAQRIAADPKDLTVVLLGTSHYGQPERFGLTRKTFETPLGRLEVDQARFEHLKSAAGESVVIEDYCHAIEHSIEFQCVFLQHALGSDFKILPILCGPFADATLRQLKPEEDDRVVRLFDALASIEEADGRAVLWVLGVDMAHVGRRYGDSFDARAGEAEMLQVEDDDRNRLEQICAGDADSFLDLVVTANDPLKWCGFSPIYTFMRVQEGVRANLVRYDQWNIDPHSVVSFAAVDFYRR